MKVIKVNKKKSIEILTERFSNLLTGISPDKYHKIYSVVYDCLEDKGYIKDPLLEQEKNVLFYAQKFVENKEYEKLYKNGKK